MQERLINLRTHFNFFYLLKIMKKDLRIQFHEPKNNKFCPSSG